MKFYKTFYKYFIVIYVLLGTSLFEYYLGSLVIYAGHKFFSISLEDTVTAPLCTFLIDGVIFYLLLFYISLWDIEPTPRFDFEDLLDENFEWPGHYDENLYGENAPVIINNIADLLTYPDHYFFAVLFVLVKVFFIFSAALACLHMCLSAAIDWNFAHAWLFLIKKKIKIMPKKLIKLFFLCKDKIAVLLSKFLYYVITPLYVLMLLCVVEEVMWITSRIPAFYKHTIINDPFHPLMPVGLFVVGYIIFNVLRFYISYCGIAPSEGNIDVNAHFDWPCKMPTDVWHLGGNSRVVINNVCDLINYPKIFYYLCIYTCLFWFLPSSFLFVFLYLKKKWKKVVLQTFFILLVLIYFFVIAGLAEFIIKVLVVPAFYKLLDAEAPNCVAPISYLIVGRAMSYFLLQYIKYYEIEPSGRTFLDYEDLLSECNAADLFYYHPDAMYDFFVFFQFLFVLVFSALFLFLSSTKNYFIDLKVRIKYEESAAEYKNEEKKNLLKV